MLAGIDGTLRQDPIERAQVDEAATRQIELLDLGKRLEKVAVRGRAERSVATEPADRLGCGRKSRKRIATIPARRHLGSLDQERLQRLPLLLSRLGIAVFPAPLINLEVRGDSVDGIAPALR